MARVLFSSDLTGNFSTFDAVNTGEVMLVSLETDADRALTGSTLGPRLALRSQKAGIGLSCLRSLPTHYSVLTFSRRSPTKTLTVASFLACQSRNTFWNRFMI